jgi:hypothetical protein
MDIDGTSNLDAVDIDGAVNMAADLTMGANIIMGDDTSIGIADDAERIEFDGAGDISVLGANFGIGTTSPTNTLNISKSTTSTDGTVYPSLKVENTSAGSGNSYANIVLHGGNGTTQFSILNDGRTANSAVTLRTDTSSPINFLTNGSTALVLDTSQNATFSGSLYIPEYIYHEGDTNTHFRMRADEIILTTGGNNCINIGTTEIRFNHDQQNIDFAIESNDNGNMFVVDAAENKIAIGGNSRWASPSGSSSGSLAHVTIAGSLRLDSMSTSTGSGTEIDSIQWVKAHGSGVGVAQYTMAEIRSFTNGGYEGGLNFYTSCSSGGGSYDIGKRLELSGTGNLTLTADKTTTYALVVQHDGNNADRYGINIITGADNAAGTNYAVRIADGDSTDQGFITFSGGTVAYGTFSAYHPCIIPDSDNDSESVDNAYSYGTLLETTSLSYTQKNGADTERGIRYNVRKSQSSNSKKVLGAYGSSMNNNEDRKNEHQALVLGDGHILCNNEGGNIEVGDGICTSSAEGIGMKATASPSMVIGIAQEDVSFSGSETKLVAVQYGLQQFTPW